VPVQGRADCRPGRLIQGRAGVRAEGEEGEVRSSYEVEEPAAGQDRVGGAVADLQRAGAGAAGGASRPAA
jgi:hypothetical protein